MARSISSDQEASMESSGGPLPHGDGPAVSVSWKLRRVMRGVYLVLVKKYQPKLAALGVHMERLLSSKKQRRRKKHSALTLSCRTMDPAAAVVHPLRRDHGGHRRNKSSGPRAGRVTSLSSLSCRSMDPAGAVYQYRPREVQFSFKSTPLHKRRRRSQRLRHGDDDDDQGRRDDRPLELEYYGSATAVTRLFELMDVEEEEEADAKATDVVNFDDDDDLDMEAASSESGPALLSAGPAPRQVRITDSPFPVTEAEDDCLVVDRRADEFITWFHEQLRTQQQQHAAVRERAAYYWIR